MDITNHLMSDKTADPLDALADDRRTQMPDVQRFCHICSTVIDHDRFRLGCLFYRQVFIRLHFL